MINKSEAIKEQIKEKEDFLMDYIKTSIASNIQKACQFWTSLELLERIMDQEEKEINKLNKMLIDKINAVAPFHGHCRRYPPLCTVTNDAACKIDNQRMYVQDTHAAKEEEMDSVQILYSQFIKEGISRELCKRVLTQHVNNGIICRKKAFNGFKFLLISEEIHKLKDMVQVSNNIIQVGPEGFEEDPSLSWIIDKFPPEEVKEIFDAIKEEAFF